MSLNTIDLEKLLGKEVIVTDKESVNYDQTGIIIDVDVADGMLQYKVSFDIKNELWFGYWDIEEYYQGEDKLKSYEPDIALFIDTP